MSTLVSNTLANGQSNVISGYELLVSHLLTAGEEIPSAAANCSWVIPYATGDFHIGCGEVEYTALTGEKKTLYHHGCLNFRLMMKEALKHIEAKKKIYTMEAQLNILQFFLTNG